MIQSNFLIYKNEIEEEKKKFLIIQMSPTKSQQAT